MQAITAPKIVKLSSFALLVGTILAGCGGSGAGVGTNNVATKLAPAYKMTAVQGPEGSTGAEIRMISPNGLIAGEYTINGKVVCFLYKDGIRTDVTPQDKDCSVMSVSDDGIIAGYFSDGNFNKPFIATASQFTELPIESGFTEGEVRGLDTSGNAFVGYFGDNVRKAARLKDGLQSEFTVPNGANVGIAAVSSLGGMVGFCQINGVSTPVAFKNGESVGKPFNVNASGLYIRTLNNLGNFVGAETVNGKSVPFAHINGHHQVLPTLSQPNTAYMLGLNDGNVAVGTEFGNKNVPTAWSQTDGVIDLTTRLQPDPDIAFFQAMSIDNHGTIVGYGLYKGKSAGVILTPVTTP